MNHSNTHHWRAQWYVFAIGIIGISAGAGMGLASWQAGDAYPTFILMLILGGLTAACGVAICGACMASHES